MKELIEIVTLHRLFSVLQLEFGDMLARRSDLENDTDQAYALQLLGAAVLASAQESHSCLKLEPFCQQILARWEQRFPENAPVSNQELETMLAKWVSICNSLQCNALEVNPEKTVSVPLIQRGTGESARFYLNRYDSYEQNIAKYMHEQVAAPASEGFTPEQIRQAGNLYKNITGDSTDQEMAICNTLKRNFSIITGGPGRGKTTVLTEILAFEYLRNPDIKIAICAPTGKASGRMKQAIDKAIEQKPNRSSDLNLEFFKQQGVDVAPSLNALKPRTVHRLLGTNPKSDYPHYNKQNPLDYDLVAVDECSMMSLQLFAQLLDALPPTAKLILLGDENQLASVETGNVLYELCHGDILENVQNPPFVNRLIVNHRSKDNEALCTYTDALVEPNGTPDIAGFFNPSPASNGGVFQAFEIDPDHRQEQIKDVLIQAMVLAGLIEEDAVPNDKKAYPNTWRSPASAQEAMNNIANFKILCPMRDGYYGVKAVNNVMRTLLGINDEYANGVPILVTQNDSVTGLSNGDIGVCFKNQVYFNVLKEDGTSATRQFSPAQLPPHETAFAMTIHKSQGSDYPNVVMLIQDKDNPVLCRELIYTGITRTKNNFTLLANQAQLAQIQKRPTIRWSGLGELLQK